MEKEPQKNKRIGRPFTRNDPRINKSGRPKTFDQLRKLAQQIGQEQVRDSNGNLLTVAEMVLRKLVQSDDARALQLFLLYGYGAPPTKIETTGLVENNKTLILHYGHQREKVEREERERLLGNGGIAQNES